MSGEEDWRTRSARMTLWGNVCFLTIQTNGLLHNRAREALGAVRRAGELGGPGAKWLELIVRSMGRFTEYSVVGRKLPTEADATPKL